MFKKLMLLLLVLAGVQAWAQVTTSEIQGVVKDTKGEPLGGAEVKVIHEPTGTVNGVVTQFNGSFTIPNLRVGGPYTLEVKFLGYKPVKIQNIYLQLGKTYHVDVTLEESTESLDQVVIQAKKDQTFDSDRTGSQTNIDNRTIEALPSITRSAADYYRLEPTASNGSFAGRNDQFNNFSLDGSIFNNPFGLDAATPGGQSNAQPVSLDAIEQIQVAVAPYDVTLSGFTGASVNAVTKSGTNHFHGTVFGYFRNQDLTGKVYLGGTPLKPELKQNQGGFSLGGPIIKNKLFFFVNYEIDDRSDIGSFYIAARPGVSGGNVSRVQAADLDEVASLLRSIGYDPGPYEGYTHYTYSDKALIKLDWNAFKGTRVTFTYNNLHAWKDNNAHPEAIFHRGPDKTVLQFYKSGYRIHNNIDSYLLEVNSTFNQGKISNKFQVGYTHFDDFRTPFSEPAPVINIVKDGQMYIVAGHEPFSIHNKLDQKVYQFTDNVNYYMGDHTITGGVSFEKFKFWNQFNLFGYGFDIFQTYTMDQFRDSVASGYIQSRFEYARQADAAGNWNITKLDVGQLGAYLQDKWEMNDKVKLTFGLRVDKPLFFNTRKYIEEKIAQAGSDYIAEQVTWYDENGNPVHLSARDLPTGQLMFSPRFGFNWDVYGDKTLQVRGGTGVFTGRLPFVWIGNHVANVGRWYFTPIAKDFKFPQVWRTNIGVDKKFKNGYVVSADIAYTKDLNGMMVRNYGLKPPSGTLNSQVDRRAVYTFNDYVLMPDYGIPANAYVFTNTKLGHAFNFTAKVEKAFENNMRASLAYSFLDSYDVNSIEAEITGDAWMRNPALGNVNKDRLSHSLYGDRHRFVGYALKYWTYGQDDKWTTTVAAYYEFAKGGRFSYTYAGDINGDGSPLNDLIYIPTEEDLAQMRFDESGPYSAQQQRLALNAFIEQDPYMSRHRGEYMEKYGALSPWRARIDVKLTQTLKITKTHRLEFNLNVINLPNLMDENWGHIKLPTSKQPIGVYLDANGEPVYSFDPALKETFTNDYSLDSRWQIQLGLRYRF